MTIVEKLQGLGIRRLGTPRSGFRYRAAGGERVSARDRERITALRIPPAWIEVAIHPSGTSAVQAIGKDAAGRWQYLYHAKHVERRERGKRERIVRFIQALPRVRRAVARDLAQPGLPREKVLAGIFRILSTCFLRPGNEEYAEKNGSYGIATLRSRHVSVKGDTVSFDFTGKSGKRQQRAVKDARLARLLRELLRHPGEVFKFRDESGGLVDVRTRHINAYIKERMGERFSAKDFRTWAANLLCASALARSGDAPASGAARKRCVSVALREVAEHLGNTPAVCRASYVFGAVLKNFENGRRLSDPVENAAALLRLRSHQLERSERALLGLLRDSAA